MTERVCTRCGAPFSAWPINGTVTYGDVTLRMRKCCDSATFGEVVEPVDPHGDTEPPPDPDASVAAALLRDDERESERP